MASQREYFALVNGIRLHVVEDGPPDGPGLLFLHGFPEFWYGWRYQIPYFAQKGYRVIVPDQRGYNLSAKPSGARAYNIETLAADVKGLIESSGCGKVTLIAHDWGAAVAWWFAGRYPELLEKLVILNVPHHTVFRHTLQTNPAQMLKSWYIFSFQLPWLPELTIKLAKSMVEQRMKKIIRPEATTEADMVRYRQAWSQPGALTGMINWYRAAVRHLPPNPPQRISVPTLLIWGAQDPFLSKEMAQPSVEMCDQGQLLLIEEAGHFVQHDAPETVNEAIAGFLGQAPLRT